MALSEDQKAVLRLLAQRGEQGYADLAALMGIGVDEVHAKALEAAEQLESEGIPAPSIPSPPGENAVEQPPPAAAEPAKESPKPAVETPEPVKPEPETQNAPVAAPKSSAAPASPSRRPKPALPEGGARAAIVAGVLVVVALIVVLVIGGGDDAGDSEGNGSSAASAGAEQTVDTTPANSDQVTQAILSPIDGGDAKGVATFGRVKNSLALQIEAEGLAPTDSGESYTIWLYESPRKMLPLASTRVDESGRIGAQVEVPTEVLAYLAKETFNQIDVSLTTDATLKASLAKATREKEAPIYTGTDVLRGPVTGPIVGAAKN